MPRPVWENPRVHLLDDLWLLTIVAILVASGVPWLTSGFEVDVEKASWGLLVLGGVHVAFSMLVSPTRPRGRWQETALTLLDICGVIVVGFIWQHVGALQNPLFLMVFVLPVVGAIFLSRWHPFLIAAVSVLVVGVVALSQAAELRWYASAFIGGDAWLTWLFGRQYTVPQPSFAGFYAPWNYLLVLLEVFAILLFACAVAAEYIGSIFERLNAHIVMARTEVERGQELWASLIQRLPLPALLVDPHTLRIDASSEFASSYLRAGEMPLDGRNLFEALQFAYPETVQALIAGSDSGAPLTVIRVGDQLRVTRVRVLHVAQKGRRLALLTIEDTTEVFCLKAALDNAEYAALVLDARGRLLAFNKPALGLFGGAAVGADAALLVPPTVAGPRWWEPGLTGRRKMHLEIGPRLYLVTCAAVPLAGEEEPIFSVSLLPVARRGAAESPATNSTTITRTLSEWR
jgi:hypothetical protein